MTNWTTGTHKSTDWNGGTSYPTNYTQGTTKSTNWGNPGQNDFSNGYLLLQNASLILLQNGGYIGKQ